MQTIEDSADCSLLDNVYSQRTNEIKVASKLLKHDSNRDKQMKMGPIVSPKSRDYFEHSPEKSMGNPH